MNGGLFSANNNRFGGMRMFLHVGEKCSVEVNKIIGIFDLESTTLAESTGDMLKRAEKQNHLTYASADIPKSFVVTQEDGEDYIFVSPIAASTLEKRLKLIISGNFGANDE